ncbi:hypothetical protein H920_15196 [Fukomys damarensis]|uniref:Uncharacterized protein n=1 Tax=Fukomys damarensis TaxID=885580 RepID=A0A091DKT9_FUKDA|nr:hypothetical protein H920_15196 [Fukomys damarensis]
MERAHRDIAFYCRDVPRRYRASTTGTEDDTLGLADSQTAEQVHEQKLEFYTLFHTAQAKRSKVRTCICPVALLPPTQECSSRTQSLSWMLRSRCEPTLVCCLILSSSETDRQKRNRCALPCSGVHGSHSSGRARPRLQHCKSQSRLPEPLCLWRSLLPVKDVITSRKVEPEAEHKGCCFPGTCNAGPGTGEEEAEEAKHKKQTQDTMLPSCFTGRQG